MSASIGPLLEADEQFNHQVVDTFAFDSPGKRLQSGESLFHMEDGSERPMRFEKLSETGFYLGAGGYHGGDGYHHGPWPAFGLSGEEPVL